MAAPITYVWTEKGFAPSNARFMAMARERYGLGEIVTLDEVKSRSGRSHDHYFAAVHEARQNLPEAAAERFPTDEHLRKYALIKAGYADSRSVVTASRAEALRVAAFIGGMDPFALVSTEGATVTHWTAKSQSMKAMGGKVFQESKAAVLEVLASLLGVTTDDLERAA